MPPITAFVVFDRIPVVGMLLDLAGTVLAANETTCRLLGRPASTIVGQTLDVMIHRKLDRFLDPQHLKRGLVDEIELSGPQGLVTVEVVMSLIPADGQEIIQLFGIDVSARKQAERMARARAEAEQQMSARQRVESLGIVAGGIAHDFNNLLVGVLAEASAAREDTSLPPATLEALRRIETGARKMSQLTRSMLAYAGRGRVDTVRLDPDGLLREMHESLGRLVRREARLTVSPGAGAIAIEADDKLIRQLIGNLVSNASEAKGSIVEVESRIIMRANVEWWQLEVSDDGVGIEAGALSRIFEPFFTTHADQTGLGLSAVQGIVRRLGGDIEVDSTLQRGSRFRVRLPVLAGVEAPPRKAPSDTVVPVAKLAGLSVLIADDEPSVRTTVRRLLERRGAHVELAVDGTEAEARVADGNFGLVILDVSMPGRTGYDVLATVRRLKPGLPVILMSGYTEFSKGAGGEEPDAFIEKPFTARGLDALIDQVLARP